MTPNQQHLLEHPLQVLLEEQSPRLLEPGLPEQKMVPGLVLGPALGPKLGRRQQQQRQQEPLLPVWFQAWPLQVCTSLESQVDVRSDRDLEQGSDPGPERSRASPA